MDFDTGFDGFDLGEGFMGDEDFGLAKSFTTAPLCMMHPSKSLAKEEIAGIPGEGAVNMDESEIKVDGFCFKLHPTEDQVQF